MFARPFRNIRVFRMSTRRLIVAVAASAVLSSGLHRGGPQPGWHLGIGGYRVGACRDDGDGRQLFDHGVRGWGTFYVGAWSGAPAIPAVAVKVRDRWCCLFVGRMAPVVVW